jgi:ActR/RegA family two-component response regulator
LHDAVAILKEGPVGDPLTRSSMQVPFAFEWSETDRSEVSLDPDPRRARILLVEDDEGAAETLTWALRMEGFDVVSAQSGRAGLAAFRRFAFDLLLIDLRLPDMPGLDVVRELRNRGSDPPFIVISGYASVPSTVELMRLGARTVFEKPVDVDELFTAVRSIVDPGGEKRVIQQARPLPPFADIRTPGGMGMGRAPRGVRTRSQPIAERWASLVLQVMQSDCDPKTIDLWAHAVCVSRTVLCECCRMIHVVAHDARDFARIARAIYRSDGRWEPEAILDIADARTLKKLLRRAGLAGVSTEAPTLASFVERQQWIPQDNPAIAAFSRLFAREP